MKNTLKNILLGGALALAVAGGIGCSKEVINDPYPKGDTKSFLSRSYLDKHFQRSLKRIDLEGTVISEDYSIETCSTYPTYSFIIDTKYGKKIVDVHEVNSLGGMLTSCSLKNVDDIINKGDNIKFKISQNEIDRRVIHITPDEFLETLILEH